MLLLIFGRLQGEDMGFAVVNSASHIDIRFLKFTKTWHIRTFQQHFNKTVMKESIYGKIQR